MLMLIMKPEPVFPVFLFLSLDFFFQQKEGSWGGDGTIGTEWTVRVTTGFIKPLIAEQTAFCIIVVYQKYLISSAVWTNTGAFHYNTGKFQFSDSSCKEKLCFSVSHVSSFL